MEELRQILATLKQPEYVHILLNPIPVYGTIAGAVALVTGLILKSRPAQLVALLLILLSTLSVWPVMEYGEGGADRVHDLLNKDGQKWLHEHEERAEHLAFIFYVTAALAVVAMLAPKFLPKFATLATGLTLVAALASLLAGAYIGHAGGQVRHTEFRQGPPPADEE